MNTFFLSEMPLYITKNRDYLSFTEGMWNMDQFI